MRRPRDHEVDRPPADERGIALQTIIIIVVMLAIAGTVATVLLTRAGTETDRLEQETDRWTGIANETGCGMAGGVWNNPGGPGSCGEPGTIVHNASTGHGSYTTCHTSSDGSPSHTHTWMDNNSDGDNDPATDDTDGSCS